MENGIMLCDNYGTNDLFDILYILTLDFKKVAYNN